MRFHAFTAWGQLYQCAGTPPAPGEAVELRDLQTWVLFRGSDHWQRIQFSSDVQGAAFAEDYQGPNVRADYDRTLTGTTVRPVARHNFHFWPGTGRVGLQGWRIDGIIVTVEARLRPATRPGTHSPCMVLDVGGDMWRSRDAPPVTGASGDVGIGRFKLVQRRWRLFSMTSGPAGLLLKVPLGPIAPAAYAFD